MPTDKPFKCMECGKTMSLKTAQRGECPKCHGSDIDVNYEASTASLLGKGLLGI